MRTMIEKFATHLKALSQKKYSVKEFILYFKQRKDNKLCLLFCNGIKVKGRDQHEGNLNENHILYDKFNAPGHYKPASSIFKAKCPVMRKKGVCIMCLKTTLLHQMANLKYKYIISNFDHERTITSKSKPNREMFYKSNFTNMILEKKIYLREPNDCIPTIIQKIYPEMNHKEYMLSIKNEEFREKSIIVCSDCFLDYMSSIGVAGARDINPSGLNVHKGKLYRIDNRVLSKDRRLNDFNTDSSWMTSEKSTGKLLEASIQSSGVDINSNFALLPLPKELETLKTEVLSARKDKKSLTTKITEPSRTERFLRQITIGKSKQKDTSNSPSIIKIPLGKRSPTRKATSLMRHTKKDTLLPPKERVNGSFSYVNRKNSSFGSNMSSQQSKASVKGAKLAPIFFDRRKQKKKSKVAHKKISFAEQLNSINN